MATSIGLGVQFTANASGMTKGLSQAEKAIQQLGRQAADASKLFDSFTGSSASAGAAQQQVATDLAFLSSAFKTGQISAQEYAAELLAITQSAQTQAAAFAEGAAITNQMATAEEKRASKLERLGQLLAQGAISEETFARASREGSSAHAAASQAEEARAKSLQRAAQITAANISPTQKYDQEVLELKEHLDAGRITQDTFNSALAKSTASFARAESAARGYDKAADAAGDGGTLKFNELSGILSALPGPIGNVAGRLSGLSSAGEGLGRVFSGGLSQGLSSIGGSVAGLINPFTVGVAAVAGFGFAAVGVGRGLGDLEDRVETLGNTADKLGVSFEFIQTLEEAGRRSGVGIETVSTAFGKLQKTLAGADEESKAATDALSKLGVSFSDLESLSPEEQIRLIGEKLKGIDDPARRTAAAMAIFGKSGADLLPFFNNLAPAAADVERLGAALTQIDRGRIDAFGAGLDALAVASQGLGQQLLLPFVGLGEGIAQGAAEFIGGVNQIVSVIADILGPELNTLGNLFNLIGIAVGETARLIASAFEVVRVVLEPISGSILPAIGAGFALINRQILIGAIGGLAGSFTAAAGAAAAYATGAGVATISTAALGVAIRTAINSTGVGVLAVAFGLAAGALLEWAIASDDASEGLGGVGGAAAGAAKSAAELAAELAREDGASFDSLQKAINGASASLSSAIDDSLQFGQAGFNAAFQFQTALESLKAQADKGILNEAAYKAEVEKATEAYKSQIDTIKEAQKAEEEKLKAVERAADAVIAADQRRADSFIQSQGLGGEDPRTKAADDLLAITRQIDEAETAIVEARAAGDRAAEEAAVKRLAILDQAEAAAQQKVEFGFTSADANKAIEDARKSLDSVFTFDNFQVAPDAFTEAQAQLQELTQQLEDNTIDPETYKLAADALRSGFEDAVKDAEKLGELQLKYAEAAAEIDKERLDKLAQVSQEPLKIQDIRTSEGASEFLRLASGRQDPAVEEYRKQLSKLDEIRKEISKVGGTVEMIGA